jgi:UDP-glucose 4-epimerase
MKILITGGAGFIGSHVTDAYVKDGHEVVVVDDLSTGFEKNLNPNARFVRMNIRDKEINDFIRKEKFDIVNHHAAQIDVRKSVADPLFDANTNILGTLNILESCVKTGVKKFIFASTGGAIYGEQKNFPADENHPASPLSPYGISKLAIEKYINYYHIQFNLSYTILRYGNVYGPRQNPHGEAGVVAIFLNKLLSNEQPVINGDGLQTRDYIFVGDVVKANLLSLNKTENDIYNVGTGTEIDVNQLFKELLKITGKNVKEVHGSSPSGEQQRSVISSEKIYKTTGWKPSINLTEGLQKTFEYFKIK